MKVDFLKRGPLAIIGAAIIVTTAHALIDADGDEMSDIWEGAHGFATSGTQPPDQQPDADPDGDGWTNLEESQAGTDPYSGVSPLGILKPTVLKHPDFSTVFTISWPSLEGKQYTLYASPDLSAGSWVQVDSPVMGTGTMIEYGTEAVDEGGFLPDRLFWKVSVSDVDTDGDTLNDWDEIQLGCNPNSRDSDGDGLWDNWELANGLDPLDSAGDNGANGDPDMDGIGNGAEAAGNTNPGDAADFPPHLMIIKNKAIGTTGATSGTMRKTVWSTESQVVEPINSIGSTAIMEAALDDMDSEFPEELEEALTEADQQVVREPGMSADASANFYLNQAGNGTTGNYSSTRVWVRAKAADYERTFEFLKTCDQTPASTGDPTAKWTSSEVVSVTIPANHTDSSFIDLRTTTQAEAGIDYLTLMRLKFITVKGIDSSSGSDVIGDLASGVDVTSVTADPASPGYKSQRWIMAPIGGQNRVEFGTGASTSLPISLSTPAATANPALLTDSPQITSFAGSGQQNAEGSLQLTLGTIAPVDSGIKVKTMKRRNVTAKVYKIASVEFVSPGQTKVVEPLVIPSAAAIKSYLDKVFLKQVNADIQVTMSPTAANQFHQVEWDISDAYDYNADANPTPTPPHSVAVYDGVMELGSTTFSPLSGAGLNPEPWLIHKDLGLVDDLTTIHVYLVPATQFAFVKKQGDRVVLDLENGSSIVGVAFRDSRTVFLAARRKDTSMDVAGAVQAGRLIGVAAHEIGHIFVGPGHPDKYPTYTNEDTVGKAPLRGTDTLQRLMHSGSSANGVGLLRNLDDYGRQLVKAEWDEADEWMKTQINQNRISE